MWENSMYADRVFMVNNLRQLADAVDRILADGSGRRCDTLGIDVRARSETSGMAETMTIRSMEDIRRLRSQIMELARKYRGKQVSVFGSCVRGEMSEDSDIDFLVDFEEEYTLLDIAGLLVGLEDLLGCKVDVIDRRSLRKELRAAVFREAQTL